MPARFDSGTYDPETTKLMKAALDAAWAQIEDKKRDPELTRLLLASSIIDQVEAGLTDPGTIAAGALEALASARRLASGVMAERLPSMED